MIRDVDELDEFNRKLTKGEDISHKKALAIFEAMRKEAVGLGVISSESIMEGLEVDLRIAAALNGLKA